MSAGAVPVLVDTNVILEAHRTNTWRALVGRFGVETVTECVTETQTGYQNRRPEHRIDGAELQRGLAAVHDVTPLQRAQALTRDALVPSLDPGEQALWAHALDRQDAWLLCGPDRASLRVGVRLGFRERLVAFEALLEQAGHRSRTPLRDAYTKAWLATALNTIAVLEGPARP